VNPNLSEPALDQPKLRPHHGLRRPLARKGCHGSAKLDHHGCWRHKTSRRTPALVGYGHEHTSPFGFARGRAANLALHRLVERRSQQLKVHRPAARRIPLGEPLYNVLTQFHQIPRDHAISPFVLASTSPVYLIRALGRFPVGFFSRPGDLRGQR
jgi:hypothetical protein